MNVNGIVEFSVILKVSAALFIVAIIAFLVTNFFAKEKA
jgi:hypothetical protein